MFYRRKKYKGWKRPAVVLGQDGQFVLVWHDAHYRIHPSRLMKVMKSGFQTKEEKNIKSKSITQSRYSTSGGLAPMRTCLSQSWDLESKSQLGYLVAAYIDATGISQ